MTLSLLLSLFELLGRSSVADAIKFISSSTNIKHKCCIVNSSHSWAYLFLLLISSLLLLMWCILQLSPRCKAVAEVSCTTRISYPTTLATEDEVTDTLKLLSYWVLASFAHHIRSCNLLRLSLYYLTGKNMLCTRHCHVREVSCDLHDESSNVFIYS